MAVAPFPADACPQIGNAYSAAKAPAKSLEAHRRCYESDPNQADMTISCRALMFGRCKPGRRLLKTRPWPLQQGPDGPAAPVNQGWTAEVEAPTRSGPAYGCRRPAHRVSVAVGDGRPQGVPARSHPDLPPTGLTGMALRDRTGVGRALNLQGPPELSERPSRADAMEDREIPPLPWQAGAPGRLLPGLGLRPALPHPLHLDQLHRGPQVPGVRRTIPAPSPLASPRSGPPRLAGGWRQVLGGDGKPGLAGLARAALGGLSLPGIPAPAPRPRQQRLQPGLGVLPMGPQPFPGDARPEVAKARGLGHGPCRGKTASHPSVRRGPSSSSPTPHPPHRPRPEGTALEIISPWVGTWQPPVAAAALGPGPACASKQPDDPRPRQQASSSCTPAWLARPARSSPWCSPRSLSAARHGLQRPSGRVPDPAVVQRRGGTRSRPRRASAWLFPIAFGLAIASHAVHRLIKTDWARPCHGLDPGCLGGVLGSRSASRPDCARPRWQGLKRHGWRLA